MPKREKELQVKLMDEEDIKYWAEQVVAPDPSEADEHRDEQLAHRVVNMADVTSIMNYLIRVSSQELYQAMQRQATDIIVLRQIMTEKLGVTEKDLDEYEEEISEKLEMNRVVMEKLQGMQARGEDITEEDLKELNRDLVKLSEQDDA